MQYLHLFNKKYILYIDFFLQNGYLCLEYPAYPVTDMNQKGCNNDTVPAGGKTDNIIYI